MKTIKSMSINKEQKLYVFNEGNGYSCLGFENVMYKASNLNNELQAGLKLSKPGTIKLLLQFHSLIKMAKDKHVKTGWRSQSELIPEFIGKEGKRVTVITNNDEKSTFRIGKSTGFIPCHISLYQQRSISGHPVYGYPFKSFTFLD